ncbi:MAG: N-acetylneuraminate synthase family protein, partial [Verrucomicrobiota bacterium]
MSANHNRDYDHAVRLIHAAKDAGADALKIQTYTADTITLAVKKPYFKVYKGSLWEDRYLHDLYQEAYTPWDWQPRLKKEAEALGLHFFSAPFDFTAVDFLEEMDVPAYKIASFENGDIPLIEKVADTGKPVIMSTGMATEKELSESVAAIKARSKAGLA